MLSIHPDTMAPQFMQSMAPAGGLKNAHEALAPTHITTLRHETFTCRWA
jgi:hypothetical protein